MEKHQPTEMVNQGLRWSVVIATFAIATLLVLLVKNVFLGNTDKPLAASPETKHPTDPTSKESKLTPPQLPNASAPTRSQFNAVTSTPAETNAESQVASSPAVAANAPTSVQTPSLAVKLSNGSAVSFGSISGKITLQGNPPAENPLPLDSGCGNLYKGAKPTTQFYVHGADGGLADVFVYITKGLEGRKFNPSAEPVVLDQVGCLYIPYVTGAMTGQTIEVRNSDSLLHNVHPTPTVAGNKESNKAMLPKSAPLLFQFNSAEVFVRFKCDIHPWMFSYVGIVDHPYFAVSDANGNFTISNVPPGNYTLEFYHRKSGKKTLNIQVKAGENTSANSTVTVP